MTRQSWIQRRQFDSELQVSGVGVGVDSEERLKVVREGVSKVPEGEARDKEGVSKVPEGEARDKEGSVILFHIVSSEHYKRDSIELTSPPQTVGKYQGRKLTGIDQI